MRGDYHWLVEVDVHDGAPIRLGHVDLEVTTAAGDVLVFAEGILSELDGTAPGDDNVTLQVLPPPGVDVLELEHSPVRVYLWREGDTWEEAALYVEGLVSGLEYAAPDDPVELSVSRQEDDLPPMPDSLAAIVDGETWPVTGGFEVRPDSNGLFYPVIYGFPGGQRNSTSSGTIAVVPVGLAQWSTGLVGLVYLAIADQPLVAGTTSSEVAIANYGESPYVFSDLTWKVVTDLLGRSITVADFSADSSARPSNKETAAEFYVGFSPAGGGGRARDAYAVVLDVLRRWGGSRPVDYGAMTRVEELLSRYAVDTWVNASTDAWSWLDDTLLHQLPVQWVQGRKGLYLAPDRYFAELTDVRRSVDVDEGEAERRSPVRVDGSRLENEVVCHFWRNREDQWWGRRILTAQDENLSSPWWASGADERIVGHPLAAESQARYGLHRGVPHEIDWTWDALTVGLVGQDYLERRAFPVKTVTYWFPDLVEVGDVLLLTDSELGWAARLVIVARPPVRVADGWVAQLRVVPRT